jgi:hypothetical protein
MVDISPIDDPTIIIIEDEDEILLPSGEIGTSLEEIEDDEQPIVISNPGETLVVQVSIPGPRGNDGAPGQDGDPGDDGRDIELQKSSTHIQWRYLGDTSWEDLIDLDDLVGPPGEDGADGQDGENGGTFPRGMPKSSTTLFGVPSVDFYAVGSLAAGTRRDMNPFEVDANLTVSAFDVEVLFSGSETVMNVGIIAADIHNQPVGSVLAQANLNVTSPGIKRAAITPVQLSSGRYLLMHQGQNAGTVTLRSYRSPARAIINTMGANAIVERLRYVHSPGQALSNAPWTIAVTSGSAPVTNFGRSFSVLMEYEYV